VSIQRIVRIFIISLSRHLAKCSRYTYDYRLTEGALYFVVSAGNSLRLPNVFAGLIDVADSTVSELYFGDSIDKISDTVRESFDF
jgi:hypothetical protein